jgi:hypothetical protein
MIPVTQTKVVVKNSNGEMVVRGNCWAAAISSLTEIPITDVPNVEVLFDVEGVSWYAVMDAWLRGNGFELKDNSKFVVFHNPAELNEDSRNALLDELRDRYYMVSGMSPRGISHVCIYKNGIMVHDPHPTREGIDESTISCFEEIVKLNP